jgi:predicted Zn-dependent protease with MMP-like domain
MRAAEFDEIVERAIRKIPRTFRRQLDNLVFVVESEPPRPGLLGLYEGVPLTERSVHHSFRMPDKITIYQRPHERMARDRHHLEKMVEETVWHEVAHYFGMDEKQVRNAERKRGHETFQPPRRRRPRTAPAE